MCGILGFITKNPSKKNYDYIRRLLILSSIRGTDATGIGYLAEDGTPIIDKADISASDFVKKNLPEHESEFERLEVLIGHTRLPTQGSPKDNHNNHPVESDDWIMVHNGTVMSLPRLKDYPYKGEVDSEVLLSYVQRLGLKGGLPYTERGSAAVALINKKEPHNLYMWRETSPIHLAYDRETETLFFASTDDILERGVANKLWLFSTFQLKKLPENYLVKISADGDFDMVNLGYLPVHKAYNTYPYGRSEWDMGWTNYGESIDPDSLLDGDNKEEDKEDKAETAKSDYGLQTSFDLKWNRESLRWELPKAITGTAQSSEVESRHSESTDVVPLEIINDDSLRRLGYDDGQISRMLASTKRTILACNLESTRCSILRSGHVYILGDRLGGSTAPSTAPSTDASAQVDDEGETGGFDIRYYIGGQSRDFKHWERLSKPNRGHISNDGTLIKKWDKVKKSHYIMCLEDAIEAGEVDQLALESDYDIEHLETKKLNQLIL